MFPAMAETRTVSSREFVDTFGVECPDFYLDVFKYKVISNVERDRLLLKVINVIFSERSAALSRAGRERRMVWESGWSECLRDFYESRFDIEKLLPRYLHPFGVMRLGGNYIRSDSPHFERKLGAIFREALFRKYLSGSAAVYEYGCGTGTVLMELAGIFPGRPLIGLDWAETSQLIVMALRDELKMQNLTGCHFDMFDPDPHLQMDGNSALLTVASLEQLGQNWEPFLDFTLAKKPSIVINIEPFIELYDRNDLMDYLASKYHSKRNYLEGYLPAVEVLAEQERVEIIAKRRCLFGNMYHEGYSYLVWRPK